MNCKLTIGLSSAVITLHNPYVNFNDPDNVSTARCIHSARCILAAYYMLTATSLDITRLHPFVTVGATGCYFRCFDETADCCTVDLLVSSRCRTSPAVQIFH